ncbi:hypothetical protein V865_005500 [Kwoniella europaea PYCC6329]|uniref:Cytochrome P450 n=1 Tax=Kwoniella europaea PYCC6329 TaxID=1423913 RepID=A0AAX4KNL9_9TREE
MTAYILYAISFLIHIIIWWYRFKPITLPGVPHWPNGHFLWGDLLRLRKILQNNGSFTDFLDLSASTLGPICQIRLGPLAHMVIITDYMEMESLLLRRHQSLDRSSQTTGLFKTILPRALLTLKTGQVWRHRRRAMGSAMTPRFLALTMPNITGSAQDLVRLWKKKNDLSRGRSWQTEKDLESATMDAICGMAFDKSWDVVPSYIDQLERINTHTDGGTVEIGDRDEMMFRLEAPDLAKSTWYIFKAVPVQSPFPAFTHFFTRLKPSYLYHVKRIDDFLSGKLYEARKCILTTSHEVGLEVADNALDLLVAKGMQEGDEAMSDDGIKQELLQYLLAGTETSSTTLAWWCKFMTNNPSIQTKLRGHLLERLPENSDMNMNFDDLSPASVPYLEAVVHETLRMARTAGGFLRDTKEDMMILGHHILKGTTLAFPTSIGCEECSPVDHKRPKLPSTESRHTTDHDQKRRVGYWDYGTGNIFDPERWLTEDGRFNPTAGPSLPFSLGQRRCFGKNLALLELRVFIAQLNLSFFFAPIPADQNRFDRLDNVISHPKDCFIRPIPWARRDASC